MFNKIKNFFRPPAQLVLIDSDRDRTTLDTPYETPFTSGFAYISPSDDHDWKLEIFNEATIGHQKAQDLMKVLVDASPDVDRALYDMLQFANPGHTLASDDPRIQSILDECKLTMQRNGQDLDTKIDKLVSSGFMGGAFYTECVFEPDGRTFSDLVVIDPFNARFQRRTDPVRGQYWQLGQVKKSEFEAFILPDGTQNPLIIYKPISSIADRPFGRPLANSAIFALVFQLGMMKDTRQVVSTQAYPRGFWKVDRKLLSDSRLSEAAQKKILDETESKLITYMTNLSKDKTKQPVIGSEVGYEIIGAMNRANLDGVEMLERIIERWVIRGLKQFPVLFGINDGNALGTTGDVQLIAHSIFMNSFQSSLESNVNNQFRNVLAAQGIETTEDVFKLKRVDDFVRPQRADVRLKETENVTQLSDKGIISRLEARTLLRKSDPYYDELDEELPDFEPLPVANTPQEEPPQQDNTEQESEDTDE